MIKNRTTLEIEVKGRLFSLECYSESPLEDVAEALAAMTAFVSDRISATKQPASEASEIEVE